MRRHFPSPPRPLLAVCAAALALPRPAAAAPPYSMPFVALRNAAAPGQTMPAVGLGTGAYGNNAANCSAWPETWRDGPCADTVVAAVSQWLRMAYDGGVASVRLDQANSYGDTATVGRAMALAGVPRENVWLLQKVGNGNAMGYADITEEFATILQNMSITYTDTVLIHWPTATAKSQEPACNAGPAYNATFCRLESWRALVDIWRSGGSRSIGVSNYNSSELQEIADSGMPLPAINQIPLNLYRSSSQMATIAWCLRHGVVVNAYSPLGVPDYHTYNTSTGMSATMLDDPVLAAVTAAHRGFSPAQVVIAWLWALGFPTNPRTLRADHMDENLSALNGELVLTEGEIAALSSRPQSACDVDKWYECAPSLSLAQAAALAPVPAPAPAPAPAPVPTAQHRNVLFLLEDDGSMDLGAYGNSALPTPHLDALAARGVVFDRFHTTVSSCSPSRASLMTGLPTHENGMYGLEHGQEHFAAFSGARSVENVLGAAGYTTGIIGKYHVAPVANFNFTWGNNPTGPGGCQAGASDIACPSTDYNFVARNITNMAQQAASFLDYAAAQGTPWMLYVGFGDSHRCGGDVVGEFCEKFGLDKQGRSTIPDWTPFHIAPADVQVPFWIQDTPAAREDLAKMYTAKNRMDQGVGLILALLEARGLANSTLVVYTADNGAPFAAGKTNMYEVATSEPMIAFAPGAARAGVRSQELASTLDLLPTWLAWAGVPLPSYSLFGPVTYTGRSLLPFITGAAAEDGADGDEAAAFPAPRHRLLMSAAEAAAATRPLRGGAAPAPLGENATRVHGSFQNHEAQEYYPMRSVVAADASSGAHYRLIYNIAERLLYPIASDLYAAPAFQDLLNRTRDGVATHWYRNFSAYLGESRAPFELFDLGLDPMELNNVAADPAYAAVLADLQADILAFQTSTQDDWIIKRVHE